MSGKDEKTEDKKSDNASTQTSTLSKSQGGDRTLKDVGVLAESVSNTVSSLTDGITSVLKAKEETKQKELEKSRAEQERLAAEAAANATIEKAKSDKDIAIDTNQTNLQRTEKEEATKVTKIEAEKETALDKNKSDLEGIKTTAQADVDKARVDAEARKKESEDKLEIEKQKLEAEKQKSADKKEIALAEIQARTDAYKLALQHNTHPNPALPYQPNMFAGYPNPSPQPPQYLPAPAYHPYGVNGMGYPPPLALPQQQYGYPHYPLVSTAGGTPLTPMQGQYPQQMMGMQGQNPQVHQMMGVQPQPGMVPYQGPQVVNPGLMPGGFFHQQAQTYDNNPNNQQQPFQPPQPGPV